MKSLFLITCLFISVHGFTQTSKSDKNGNPVFNSVTLLEETVKDFKLSTNYYTLKNNLENKGSSVYVSDAPTLEQIANAAVNLPSDFFIISRGQEMVNLIIIINKPSRLVIALNPASGKRTEYDCSLKGDITESRANEIIKEKFDPAAKIEKGQLFFNNQKISIIPNDEIKRMILKLIAKNKLSEGEPSNLKVRSAEELRSYILKESKEGGKLDFFTPIKGKEYDGLQIKPGIYSTNISLALYKWGSANFDLGVNTVDDAFSIFEEFKGKAINQREKEYIKMGFGKALEK